MLLSRLVLIFISRNPSTAIPAKTIVYAGYTSSFIKRGPAYHRADGRLVYNYK
jgi:hypothetical protein